MSRSPTDDALLPAAAARGCLLCLLVRNARAGQGAAGIGAPIQVASCMHAHRGTATGQVFGTVAAVHAQC